MTTIKTKRARNSGSKESVKTNQDFNGAQPTTATIKKDAPGKGGKTTHHKLPVKKKAAHKTKGHTIRHETDTDTHIAAPSANAEVRFILDWW